MFVLIIIKMLLKVDILLLIDIEVQCVVARRDVIVIILFYNAFDLVPHVDDKGGYNTG